ncbi:STAS domain-containing protein [Streptomyces lavendofoliae]|uniref:STAS domain-containing protein n=1 Tax=Streptomyces lavendofoliae TaxID=67314 RepID=UPI00300EB256
MTDLITTTRTTPTGPIAEVAGDLDYHSAVRLREAIRVIELRPGETLVLDLRGLTFCDSSGISVLIAAHRQAEIAQARMILRSVPRNITRVLQTVGLDQLFDIRDGPETNAPRQPTRTDLTRPGTGTDRN